MNEANNKPSDSPLAGESDQRPEQKPQAARQDKIPFDHGNIIIPVFPISILDYYALQEFERILRRTKQDGPDWDVEKEKQERADKVKAHHGKIDTHERHRKIIDK